MAAAIGAVSRRWFCRWYDVGTKVLRRWDEARPQASTEPVVDEARGVGMHPTQRRGRGCGGCLCFDVVAVHRRPDIPELCSTCVPLRYGPIHVRLGILHSYTMYRCNIETF